MQERPYFLLIIFYMGKTIDQQEKPMQTPHPPTPHSPNCFGVLHTLNGKRYLWCLCAAAASFCTAGKSYTLITTFALFEPIIVAIKIQ